MQGKLRTDPRARESNRRHYRYRSVQRGSFNHYTTQVANVILHIIVIINPCAFQLKSSDSSAIRIWRWKWTPISLEDQYLLLKLQQDWFPSLKPSQASRKYLLCMRNVVLFLELKFMGSVSAPHMGPRYKLQVFLLVAQVTGKKWKPLIFVNNRKRDRRWGQNAVY